VGVLVAEPDRPEPEGLPVLRRTVVELLAETTTVLLELDPDMGGRTTVWIPVPTAGMETTGG
jgi:hypothetical protein